MKKLTKILCFVSLVVFSTGNSFGMLGKKKLVGINPGEFTWSGRFSFPQCAVNAISENGKYLACGCSDGFVKVYNIKNKKKVFSYENKEMDPVRCISLSANGKYVAFIVGMDSRVLRGTKIKVKVHDIEKKKEIFLYEIGDGHMVFGICFSRDGKCIAFGTPDGNVRVYDIENKKEVCSYKSSGGSIYSVHFSSDGKYLASGSKNGFVTVYDMRYKKKICSYKHSSQILPYVWDSKAVPCVRVSSDGKFIASGGRNKRVVVYDIKKKKIVFSPLGKGSISSLCFSPDGKYLISGERNLNRVNIHDIKNEKTFFLYEHDTYFINVIHLTPDDKKLISVDCNGGGEIYNTSKEFRKLQKLYKQDKNKFREKDRNERINYIVENII